MASKDFCKNMNYYRSFVKELTFAELSDKLKSYDIIVTAATLQRYEVGKIKAVPYDTILALSQIFGIEPADLVGWGKPIPDHRSVNIDERVNDFITELTLRDTTFYLDGNPLKTQQLDTIKLLAEQLLQTARQLIKIE